MSLGHSIRWLLFDDEGWKLRAPKKIDRAMFSITIYIFLASTVVFVDTAMVSFLIRWREIHSLVWFDTFTTALVWMSILLIADAVLVRSYHVQPEVSIIDYVGCVLIDLPLLDHFLQVVWCHMPATRCVVRLCNL
ncbi:hypothetical protein JOM56_011840 [Amanita muscaria]